MRADDDVDRAALQPGQDLGALAALFAAGQDRGAQSGARCQRRDGGKMLTRQDFGRRHQRRLAAGLDGARHGKQRHHRLAGADIALQQAQHAVGLGEVGVDFGQRLLLRAGQANRAGPIVICSTMRPSPVSGRPESRDVRARTSASEICPARNSS